MNTQEKTIRLAIFSRKCEQKNCEEMPKKVDVYFAMVKEAAQYGAQQKSNVLVLPGWSLGSQETYSTQKKAAFAINCR